MIKARKKTNRKENLRILCPNCHQQTETWGNGFDRLSCQKREAGTNSEKGKERIFPTKSCIFCRKEFTTKGKDKNFCSKECYHTSTRGREILKTRKVKNRPTKEELLDLIEKSNFSAVGRKFGVSDNAIRKWIKK